MGMDEKSNGSWSSQPEEDLPVPSQGGSQDEFLSKPPVSRNSYPAFRIQGGRISEIINRAIEDIGEDDPDVIKNTAAFLQSNAHGIIGALPMRCKGEECPIVDVCPITGTGKSYPLGKQCPFEQALVVTWVNKHLEALGIDDYDDPQNSVDMDMIYQIAAQELLSWRAGHHLSKKGNIIEDKPVGSTQDGYLIFAEVVSPALEAIQSSNKLIMKLRDALLATRKSQIQAGKEVGDYSKKASELAEQARNKVLDRLDKLKEDVKDAEFDIKED